MYKGNTSGDLRKQEPKSVPSSVYAHATQPAITTVSKRPSYVIINQSGSYAFSYESSASNGAAWGTPGYYKNAVNIDDTFPFKLEIQPIAWSGSAKDTSGGDGGVLPTGAVTFVYKGGQ
tara:strand:- start:530 stop:886 length:357 start_codon:yes stop_codon:yes gene_type:complete